MISFNSEKLFEDFLEKNIDWLKAAISADGELFRQPRLGSYGVADFLLVAVERTHIPVYHIHLVELKNTPLSYKHLGQCARYKRFFEELEDEGLFGGPLIFNASLIGMKTFPTDCDLCFLAQEIDWLNVYETDIDPSEGLDLKLVSGWHKNNIGEADYEEFLSLVSHMISNEDTTDGEK